MVKFVSVLRDEYNFGQGGTEGFSLECIGPRAVHLANEPQTEVVILRPPTPIQVSESVDEAEQLGVHQEDAPAVPLVRTFNYNEIRTTVNRFRG